MSNPLDFLSEEIKKGREQAKIAEVQKGAPPKKGLGFLKDLEKSLEEGKLTSSADHLRKVTHKVIDLPVEQKGNKLSVKQSARSIHEDYERDMPDLDLDFDVSPRHSAPAAPHVNPAEQRAQMKQMIREEFMDLVNEAVTERIIGMFSKEVIIKTIKEIQAARNK